jgi:mannose-6-phosphate isomerase-like protein (cupin superfamily)
MRFTTEPHRERIEKPWGHEIIYTPKGVARTGKVLFIKAGHRLSFQYHDEKEETLCLFSGRALVWLEDDGGEIRKVPMEPLAGYTVRVGQKHRVEAIEDSLILEVSDPEKGNTYRIEDDHARTTETEAMRGAPGRGWVDKSRVEG